MFESISIPPSFSLFRMRKGLSSSGGNRRHRNLPAEIPSNLEVSKRENASPLRPHQEWRKAGDPTILTWGPFEDPYAKPSRIRQRHNDELLRQIWEVYTRSRRLYGSPRITAELKRQGFRCGKNRVARIMREHSIGAAVKKRRFRRTTDSRHPYALASNLLIERSQTEGVWASDITYVPTSEVWLYLFQFYFRDAFCFCMRSHFGKIFSDCLRTNRGT